MNKIPFGLATITIGTGADALALDGKDYFQAEGGELSIEPDLGAIEFQDYGSSPYDERIMGYTGELTVVVGQNDLKLFEKLYGFHSKIVDGATSEVIGLTDEAIGTSMRDKAVPVKIHPREMGDDPALDINIYKMAGVGAFGRVYETAQGTYEVTMKMYVRDNADPTKPGNFYYIGDTDPNAPVTP